MGSSSITAAKRQRRCSITVANQRRGSIAAAAKWQRGNATALYMRRALICFFILTPKWTGAHHFLIFFIILLQTARNGVVRVLVHARTNTYRQNRTISGGTAMPGIFHI